MIEAEMKAEAKLSEWRRKMTEERLKREEEVKKKTLE